MIALRLHQTTAVVTSNTSIVHVWKDLNKARICADMRSRMPAPGSIAASSWTRLRSINQNGSDVADSGRSSRHGSPERGIKATQNIRDDFLSAVAMLRNMIGVLNCEWNPIEIAISLNKDGLIGLH